MFTFAGSKGGFRGEIYEFQLAMGRAQPRTSNNLLIIYWHLMHCASRLIKVKFAIQYHLHISFSSSSVNFSQKNGEKNGNTRPTEAIADDNEILCIAMYHAVRPNLFLINRI